VTTLKTVAIVGEYSPSVIDELKKRLSRNFRCICIPSSEEFDKLHEADYVILRGPKMYADVLEPLKGKLKFIQRWGTGYDGVDIKRAGELGIAVAIAKGINSNAVSELTIALILALYRHLVPLHNSLINGKWERQRYIDETYEIRGKTVGLIGCGSIGRLVAKKVQAFGAKVIYFDKIRLSTDYEKELNIECAEMDKLVSQADIISLHLPATPDTKGMVNKTFIKKMKPNAVLVNTSRGSIINEKDLYTALKKRRILGAALDTFAQEPPAADNPLFELDNIVVTPHVGGNTVDMNSAMIDRVVNNIIRIDNNQPLPDGDLVNGDYLVSTFTV